MDQPLCLYERKLKDAVVLFKAMSPDRLAEAVVIWDNATSQIRAIVNPGQDQDPNRNQNLSTPTGEHSSALFDNPEYGDYTSFESIDCDTSVINDTPSNVIAHSSQMSPPIKQAPTDSFLHGDIDNESYVNISFNIAGNDTAPTFDDLCVDKMALEATGSSLINDSPTVNLDEELFHPNIEQAQSITDRNNINYSDEGIANDPSTAREANQLDSVSANGHIDLIQFDSHADVDGYNNSQTNSQTIIIGLSNIAPNRNDSSTQSERPLQQIQIFNNDYTCQSYTCGNNKSQYPYCGECNVGFGSNHELDRHKEMHCSGNNQQIAEEEDDPLHIAEVKREIGGIIESCAAIDRNLHTCELCGKSGFSTKGNLKRHRKSHSGEKPFKCEYCDRCFTEKKSLKIHLRRHTGEKPYKCQVCDKPFSQTGVLQSHMACHRDERKFECERCGKAFRQRSQLKLHLMRHEGIKRLECTTCCAKFLTKGDLERHRRIHTGVRPYLCIICDKTFTRQQSLNEHINRHTGNKPYGCKSCDKTFSEMSACYKHAKTHRRQEQQNQLQPTS